MLTDEPALMSEASQLAVIRDNVGQLINPALCRLPEAGAVDGVEYPEADEIGQDIA